MTSEHLNKSVIKSLNLDTFTSARGFPWYNFQGILKDERYRKLCEEFPPIESFELQTSPERKYFNKHYYLAYEKSVYHRTNDYCGKGVIKHRDLPNCWQSFIDELATSPIYQDLIKKQLGVRRFKVRYAWHIAYSGTSVAPHTDAKHKIGTHIFYFNSSDDWNPAWGGSTALLIGKSTSCANPTFMDFAELKRIEFLDNSSLLFKNTDKAWHGVEPLNSPEGHYRRTFNVIFMHPNMVKDYMVKDQKCLINKVFRWGKRSVCNALTKTPTI
jgi:hypothetical protein